MSVTRVIFEICALVIFASGVLGLLARRRLHVQASRRQLVNSVFRTVAGIALFGIFVVSH